MATTQFRTHPEVTGMGLGFFEESRNGYRIIGHGGDLSWFHSHLSLLMDEGVGFFISVNSAGSGGGLYGIREAVRDGFLERYFPRTTAPEPVVADAREQARKVTGPYTLSRRGETTLGRVMSLVIPLRVEANPDGSVQVPFVTGPNGQPIRWYAIGPLTFRNADGSERIGFVTDSSGAVSRMAFIGGHELHRVGLADNRSWNLLVIGAAVAVFLATLLLWPVAGVIRRRYGKGVPDDGSSRGLRAGTRVVSLLSLGFLIALGLFVYLGISETISLDRRTDPLLGAIRALGLVAALGSLVVLVACIRSWTRGTNGLARLKYTAQVVACVGFTWFIVHWNMLSWKFDY